MDHIICMADTIPHAPSAPTYEFELLFAQHLRAASTT